MPPASRRDADHGGQLVGPDDELVTRPAAATVRRPARYLVTVQMVAVGLALDLIADADQQVPAGAAR